MQVTVTVVVPGGGSVKDWVSLYNSGWPGTHLCRPPVSASLAGIKGVCHHTPLFVIVFD